VSNGVRATSSRCSSSLTPFRSFPDAVSLYEKAWASSSKTSAPLGYKLAFNQLKTRDFTRALDTAREVLKAAPGYPRIREDIIVRATAMIRP
jgi:hypothetical protein